MTSKNTARTDTRAPRFRVPRGKVGAASAVVIAQAASLLAVIVVFYIIAFFVAVRVVPITMGFVKDGTGVTLDMPVETVVAVWIAPSLFLLGLLFWLVVVVMRSIWKLRTALMSTVKSWAFGRESASVTPLAPAKKPARPASSSSAKTA